jgi:hypothetical protein
MPTRCRCSTPGSAGRSSGVWQQGQGPWGRQAGRCMPEHSCLLTSSNSLRCQPLHTCAVRLVGGRASQQYTPMPAAPLPPPHTQVCLPAGVQPGAGGAGGQAPAPAAARPGAQRRHGGGGGGGGPPAPAAPQPGAAGGPGGGAAAGAPGGGGAGAGKRGAALQARWGRPANRHDREAGARWGEGKGHCAFGGTFWGHCLLCQPVSTHAAVL